MPLLAKLLSMNPYRPKKVDAFDHVIHFSLKKLLERVSSVTVDAEKGETKKDYLSNFLESKELYPDVVDNDNIVMYILTNVSGSFYLSVWPQRCAPCQARADASHFISQQVLTQSPPSKKLSYTTFSATPACLTSCVPSWMRPICRTRRGTSKRTRVSSLTLRLSSRRACAFILPSAWF